ncbi:MAG TPA: hypothetical protein VEI96_00350 [Thermodesulfovibrionales bacterium]|nr:hypothetical protein [Thermodesulfovibrionales bacterium]
MKILRRTLTGPIIACSLILLSAVYSWGSSTTAEGVPRQGTDLHSKELKKDSAMAKILPVLESRVGDQKLLERAKDKLALMDEAEIRLIASLCERISLDRGTPDADIAFLLVTALIVLS